MILTVDIGNSNICFFCFSRSIDHTAHNCDLNVQWDICNHLFNLICKSDQINLGSSACRTGYNLNSACAKSQCL